MTSQPDSTPAGRDTQKAALNKRLEDLGWGLFLLMTGALWLVPAERVPHGAWLIGTGLLLLALNAARYVAGMRISIFTTLLGAVALSGGLADLTGVRFPLLAICLIVIGASMILKPLLGRST